MKKGFIGPFQLGILSGASQVLLAAEKITQERGADVEAIFYASAFQAGVDHFLLPHLDEHPPPQSDFLTRRTTIVPQEASNKIWKAIDGAFSIYLSDRWFLDEKYSEVAALRCFLADLVSAMSSGSSLLSAWGVPDFAKAEPLLPSELAVPIRHLLSSIGDFQVTSPVPHKSVLADDVQRFNEIISGDLFKDYSAAQSALDDAEAGVDATLPAIAQTARNILKKNGRLLQLKDSAIGVLQMTPKIIDAAFGKLPGVVAEIAATAGINLMQERRRIIIYDFQSSTQETLVSNLVRMIKAADARALITQAEITS